MKKIVLAIFALGLMTANANADSVTTSCWHNRYGGSCTTKINPDPAPLTYTAEEIAAIKAREDEWFTYCRPHDEVGKDGLLRAVYAHKDCDIGVYKPGKRAE